MMRFNQNDGGRASSRRPKQSNDCVVRAVAIACGVSYDESYDSFKADGRMSGRGVKRAIWKSALGGGVFNTEFKYIAFPAQIGRPRMNVERFCAAFPVGVFIIKTAKHVSVVSDGILNDDSFTVGFTNLRCVYGAFEAVKTVD